MALSCLHQTSIYNEKDFQMIETIKGYLLTITAATSISLCVIMSQQLSNPLFSSFWSTTSSPSHIVTVNAWYGESPTATNPSVILFIPSCTPGKACVQVLDEHQADILSPPDSRQVYYLSTHLFEDARKLFTFAGSI